MVFYFSKPYFKNRTNKNKQNLSVLFETKKKKSPANHILLFLGVTVSEDIKRGMWNM